MCVWCIWADVNVLCASYLHVRVVCVCVCVWPCCPVSLHPTPPSIFPSSHLTELHEQPSPGQPAQSGSTPLFSAGWQLHISLSLSLSLSLCLCVCVCVSGWMS